MSILRKIKRELPQDRQMMDAGLAVAAEMITDNASSGLRDGRRAHSVADLVEASRRVQISLHEAVERALAQGTMFEELAGESHLSPEYLRTGGVSRGSPATWQGALYRGRVDAERPCPVSSKG
ncbi:hypothetical protein [Streptomyces sp. NBC_00239]|uniref:hypothetical protein n=1 Tax=Streptomyces sp. NBC_00239 TaxID=2903640 RepID=UPI002E2C1EB4|nr:hypothetical protein [Streptomyces sp. NBC_00239]